MSQNPSDTEMNAAGPAKAEKGWFGRNWWWVLLLAIGLPLVCCGGFVGLGFWGFSAGMDELKKMPPYADSVALLSNDPDAQAALGSPVEVAGFIEAASAGHPFVIDESNFDASLPVSGPNGAGLLVIDATLDASGNWDYSIQELQMDDGTTIDFLEDEEEAETEPVE